MCGEFVSKGLCERRGRQRSEINVRGDVVGSENGPQLSTQNEFPTNGSVRLSHDLHAAWNALFMRVTSLGKGWRCACRAGALKLEREMCDVDAVAGVSGCQQEQLGSRSSEHGRSAALRRRIRQLGILATSLSTEVKEVMWSRVGSVFVRTELSHGEPLYEYRGLILTMVGG